MTPIQLSYLSSPPSLDEFPSLHFSFRITRASKSWCYTLYQFGNFKHSPCRPIYCSFSLGGFPFVSLMLRSPLSRSTHSMNGQVLLNPWQVFQLFTGEPTHSFFSFLNFSIYIILYFLLKIKLFLSTRQNNFLVYFLRYTSSHISAD